MYLAQSFEKPQTHLNLNSKALDPDTSTLSGRSHWDERGQRGKALATVRLRLWWESSVPIRVP